MKIKVSWIQSPDNKGEDTFDVPDNAGFNLTPTNALIVQCPGSPIAVYPPGCWSKATRLTDDGKVAPAIEAKVNRVTNPDLA